MILAVHQPQYLPWLGYFDKINRADFFVFLDTVQFKKNEWQNRNKIKTSQSWQWLTVPVIHHHGQRINDVRINNTAKWQHKHKQAILSNYRKAPYYHYVEEHLEEIFSYPWERLSDLNIRLVKKLVQLLEIATPLYIASYLGEFPEDPDERLIALTKHFHADTYLTGIGGHNYMDMDKYEKNDIRVIWQDYKHPVYDQLFGAFESHLSVIDLLLNHGHRSLSILQGG